MYIPEAKKPFMERVQDRLAASRFLTFSALLHAVLIFLGGGAALYKHVTDTPDFAASCGDLAARDHPPQTPQLNVPTLSAITTNNVTTPTFQVAAMVPAMRAPTNDMTKAIQNASKVIGKGGGGIPRTMAARVGGTAREAAMQMNGGKK